MSTVDLYAVLGVPRTATPAEISHAYRGLVRRHHPDTRADADASSDAALQQILAAYAVLHDPGRRADYDQRTARSSPRTARRHQPRAAPSAPEPPIVAGPVRWQPARRRHP